MDEQKMIEKLAAGWDAAEAAAAKTLATPEQVALNIARWHIDKAKEEKKHQQLLAEAARRGITPAALKQLRRDQWELRNCRSTIGQIVDCRTGSTCCCRRSRSARTSCWRT
jgi:hypothetical protein